MIKVAVFTGNRSEYGLLRKLIKEIEDDHRFKLQLIVSGGHLSNDQGKTINEIEADGVIPAALIRLSMDGEPPPTMACLTGEALSGVGKTLESLDPKFLIVLGDRYETFAAAAAAHLQGVKVVHLHGGETTEGALDEKLRHAITQLGTWHFTAAEEYRERVIRMGHSPENVFNVGPMAIDQLLEVEEISRHDFEALTGYTFGKKNLLVTYHSETLSEDKGAKGCDALLKALERVDCNILFTHPNPDDGGRLILSRIEEFSRLNPRERTIVPSLGASLYIPALYLFDCMVGNSSSGIIEAPLTGLPVVNIGDRQRGRLRYGPVLDASTDLDDIALKIHACLDIDRQASRDVSTERLKSPATEIMHWLITETMPIKALDFKPRNLPK